MYAQHGGYRLVFFDEANILIFSVFSYMTLPAVWEHGSMLPTIKYPHLQRRMVGDVFPLKYIEKNMSSGEIFLKMLPDRKEDLVRKTLNLDHRIMDIISGLGVVVFLL